MEKEIFVFVENYEGYYLISNMGNLMSYPRWDRIGRYQGGKMIKKCLDTDGYETAILYKDGVGENVKIHRLVAQSFIPNPENYPCIDHINGIRNNNIYTNLRWCTIAQNNTFDNAMESREKAKINSLINGSKSPFARKIKQLTLDGDYICSYSSISEASYKTGFSSAHISSVCNKKRNSCGRYKWEYDGEPVMKMPKGRSNGGKTKAIFRIDINGDIIKEYNSINGAAKELGLDSSKISRVVNGQRKSVNGYFFKFK